MRNLIRGTVNEPVVEWGLDDIGNGLVLRANEKIVLVIKNNNVVFLHKKDLEEEGVRVKIVD